MSDRSTCRLATSAFLVFFLFVSSVAAQSVPDLQVLSEEDFFSRGWAHRLLKDQESIWLSPSRIKASDAKWLLPLAGGTAFALTRDTRISQRFDNKLSLEKKSLAIGHAGAYAAYGLPGAFLAIGKLTGNGRLEDTGQRGFQAALYSAIAAQSLKLVTNRTRPYKGGDGSFWNGGNSFPSGHSMHAWALAKVVSDSYSEKPLLKIGMYSFATAVSLSRVTAGRHYVSDVMIGSAIGYLIGKFVMRKHRSEEN